MAKKINMKKVKARAEKPESTKKVFALNLDVETFAAFTKLVGRGNLSRTVNALLTEYIAAHKGGGKK
jgi:uncharacterized protein (DUF4415 family)